MRTEYVYFCVNIRIIKKIPEEIARIKIIINNEFELVGGGWFKNNNSSKILKTEYEDKNN